VVGDDVDHDPEPGLPGRLDQGVEALAAAEVLGQTRVVDDVVAVHRAGSGLQDRGQVEVGDPEPG
jgi:hypothetical protein